MKQIFNDQARPFLEHLTELRNRVLRVFIALTAMVGILLVVPNIENSVSVMLFKVLQAHCLPSGIKLIFIDSIEPIFVITKLAVVCSVLIASPYILYEVIAFIGPGLIESELKTIIGIIFFGTALLGTGMLLSYYILIPATFAILIKYGILIGGIAQITFSRFFNMLIVMFFVFAAPFEVPMVILFFNRMGIITASWLKEKRRFLYVSFFIFGAVVTPDPTPFSQTILSISMIILYEIGYLICLVHEKKPRQKA